jgi:ABC-type lipoprotein release transport system permease subunit
MLLPFSYSVRNLRTRPTRSLMTAGVIALVVAACSLLLALISSLKATLATTGHPLNLVVLRKGSGTDGSSLLSPQAFRAVRYWDGIQRDTSDRPRVSPELVVQPFFYRLDGGRENVLVRGVEPIALTVHPTVTISEGRMFQPSAGEAVVGRGVLGRYVGARVGDALQFGRSTWRVVGVLDAQGTSFESEVWVDARELANDAKRPWPYSGLRIRAASVDEQRRLQQRIDADPRYALEALPETEYYAKQAESANSLYVLVIGIALLAGIGAGFGAANTMYAAVQARRAEIGTLRALGFSRAAILTAFQLEALVLAGAGFALGCVLAVVGAWLVRVLLGSVGFNSSTFTTSVITLRLSASDLQVALLVAVLIGLGGGFGPAWRAARMRPIEALRHA